MVGRFPLLLACFGTLLAAGNARAGWVQEPGAYYLKAWNRTVAGDRVFLLDGEIEALGISYQQHVLNVYAEYGVTRDTTVVLQAAPLGFMSAGSESTPYSGVTALALRFSLAKGTVPLALELGYGYSPQLSNEALAEGSVAGTRYVVRPTIQQHLGRGHLTAGFAADIFWFKAGAGAVFSSGEDIDPALEGLLSLGLTTSFGLGVALSSVLHMPIHKPEFIDVTGVGNTRYLGVELSLSYWFSDHFAISAGLGTAPFAESNAAAPALSLGVEIR